MSVTICELAARLAREDKVLRGLMDSKTKAMKEPGGMQLLTTIQLSIAGRFCELVRIHERSERTREA